MNKKKMVTTLGSLALVGAIGVGATLAYFSDTAGQIKNTFVMTEGLDIALDESNQAGTDYKNDTTDTVKRTATGNDYLNVAPGQTLYKDPQVTVIKKKTPQWVFMSVLESENVKVQDYNREAWTEITSEVPGVRVFYMEVDSDTTDLNADDTHYTAEGTQLPKLFEHVKVDNTDIPGTVLMDIKVKAATIQKEGFETAAEAYAVEEDGTTPIKTFLTTFED